MVVSGEKGSSGGVWGTHTGVSEGPARQDGREGTPKWDGRARGHERTPEGEAQGRERSPAGPQPRSCEGGGAGGGAGAAGGDGGRAGRVPAPRRSPRTLPPSAAAASGSRAAPRPGSCRSRSAAIAMSFLL